MDKKFSFFPIIIETLEEGGFFADCPSLQGCHAEGASYAEAIENIQNIIEIQIAERKKRNDFLPNISIPQTSDLRFSLPLPVSA